MISFITLGEPDAEGHSPIELAPARDLTQSWMIYARSKKVEKRFPGKWDTLHQSTHEPSSEEVPRCGIPG